MPYATEVLVTLVMLGIMAVIIWALRLSRRK